MRDFDEPAQQNHLIAAPCMGNELATRRIWRLLTHAGSDSLNKRRRAASSHSTSVAACRQAWKCWRAKCKGKPLGCRRCWRQAPPPAPPGGAAIWRRSIAAKAMLPSIRGWPTVRRAAAREAQMARRPQPVRATLALHNPCLQKLQVRTASCGGSRSLGPLAANPRSPSWARCTWRVNHRRLRKLRNASSKVQSRPGRQRCRRCGRHANGGGLLPQAPWARPCVRRHQATLHSSTPRMSTTCKHRPLCSVLHKR